MSSSLSSATQWAKKQFGEAELGDKRRTGRLVKLASALAENPSGTLPEPLPQWKDLKAAYRLLDNGAVSYEKVIAPHCAQTRQACQMPGEYFLIEDTTDLDFTSHAMAKDLGRIGNDGGQGLHLHTTLAACVQGWNKDQEPAVVLTGIFGQLCWARRGASRRGRESKRQRLQRERESQRWAAVFDEVGCPPHGVRWTYMADRESDIYEVFDRCDKWQVDYIIRACRPRALVDEEGSVFTAVAGSPVLGRFTIDVRSRPGRPARKATLEVRSQAVTLRPPWRPEDQLIPRPINVVEAREVNAPAAVDAIHWVLLTSWPRESFHDAKKIVATYSRRWLVEEYHKALKSGARIERTQLSTADGIKALLGVLALVALRLLNMKLLARCRPDESVSAQTLGPEVLKILEARFAKPKEGWSNRTLLIAIARIGGFLARKRDGDPGWITIWRGWEKLMHMVEGFRVARSR